MFSLIVPVYNAACYLERCIHSITLQNNKEWECILVDDGSTDGCGNICKLWTERDSRFIYIQQENSGVSVARNKALSIASGEWITFVDADDWLDENYLSDMLSAAGDCDLVVSGQIREFSDHRQVYEPDSFQTWSLCEEHASDFNSLNEKFLLYAPHEKLFKNDIIKRHGLRFEPGCSYGEDLQFVYGYLEQVKKISTVNKAMYHYRMADGGTLSTVFRKDQFAVDYKQWRIVHDFYKNHCLMTEEASCYLYKRLWGVVYDGLFLVLCMPQVSWNYISSIMSIPEIKELKTYKDVFHCSAWIKYSILFRLSVVMFCYFKMRK